MAPPTLDYARPMRLTVLRMTTAEVQRGSAGFEAAAPEPGCLCITLHGDWQLGAGIPSAAPVLSRLAPEAETRHVVFESAALGTWDSSLLVFLLQVRDGCDRADISFVADGLPPGAARLLGLARAVPEQGDRTAAVVSAIVYIIIADSLVAVVTTLTGF